MPQYLIPNTSNLGTIQYATIGRPVYSFGYSNNQKYPLGPPSPGNVALSTTSNSSANIAGTLFVQTTYSFPSAAGIVSPNSSPQGFPSNIANIAVTAGNGVIVTSPAASLDINGSAVGYNVFAGYSANTANLVNNSIIPIGTNFNITSNVQLQGIGGAIIGLSSKTNTLTPEFVTNGEAGLQFAIPVSGSNFLGQKSITVHTKYVPAANSVNVAVQYADIDGMNNYTNVAFLTNPAGDFITLSPVNAGFVRAFIINSPGAANSAIISFRID